MPGRNVRVRQISTAANASAAVALPALTSSAVRIPSTVPNPPGEIGMNVASRLTPNANSVVANVVEVAAPRWRPSSAMSRMANWESWMLTCAALIWSQRVDNRSWVDSRNFTSAAPQLSRRSR